VTRLLAARLLVALFAFGLAVVVVGVGGEGAQRAEKGLFGTLAAAFLATVLFASLLPRMQRLARLAAAQLATDIAMVTALVAFSGGGESVFSFLYLPIAVYGALLFGRRGAYGAAVLSSAGYAVAIALGRWWAPDAGDGGTAEVSFALWCAHSGALLLVALLSSVLARELQDAGQRLLESRGRLEELRSLHERTVACLTSGVLTTGADGCITSFNPEAERIVGRPAAEVIGLQLEEVLPGASRLARRRMGEGERSRERLQVQGPAGAVRHLGIAASILRDPSGSPAGHVVIFQDVTEVVRMENELRRQERLAGVGQLAADIAHEIRNPLAAISGSIEILAGEGHPLGPSEGSRLMRIVIREIERLDSLITDFLEYARPAPPALQEVDLAEVVSEVLGLQQASQEEGVRLEVQVPAGLRLLADPKQLRQILWNLVRNACDALGGPGRIRVHAAPLGPSQGPGETRRKASEEGPMVAICVSDDGCGIAPETLERIFDPFFTTKPEGTGLGLATVHRIATAHGGRIEVESTAGRGTTFRLVLRAAVGRP